MKEATERFCVGFYKVRSAFRPPHKEEEKTTPKNGEQNFSSSRRTSLSSPGNEYLIKTFAI